MNSIIEKYSSLDISAFREHIYKVSTESLTKIKKNLDNRYYNTGQPVIEDLRYDMIVDLLTERGATLKVGCKLRESDNKTVLPFYLGGMDKIKKGEISKLDDWKKDNKSDEYIISDKLNGVSCLAVFEKDTIKLYTRGDCTEGADISYLAPLISTIPKTIKKSIAVRGEFIIPTEVFAKNHKDKKNSLSTIIGLINSKTLKAGVGDIEFVAYEIVDDKPTNTPQHNFKILEKLGFKIARYEIVKDISSDSLAKDLDRRTSDSHYEIDGLVVQGNVKYNRNNLASSGNPDYAFAFKMLMEVVEAIVKDVKWNVSRYGLIIPTICMHEKYICGIDMNNMTGFDASYIRDNKINVGSKILVTRSGSIIPYIVSVVTQSAEPKMPDRDYYWGESGVNIHVKGECPEMLIEKLIYFFTATGVKHVNTGIVTRFVTAGLDTIPLILRATVEDFLKIPRFKRRLAEKIHTDIHTGIQNIEMCNLICASCVFESGLGVKKSKLITDNINILTDDVTVANITTIDGFSKVTAEKIIRKIPDFREFFKSISEFITIKKADVKIGASLSGKKYVFSGFRDKDLEDLVTKNGGTIVGTVSSKTTALIVSKLDGTSSKVLKAQQLGVQIINRESFKVN